MYSSSLNEDTTKNYFPNDLDTEKYFIYLNVMES